MSSQKSMDLIDSFEKIPVKIFETPKNGAAWVAKQIATLIKEKAARGEQCVLGLATGSTPKSLYAELVRLHQEEGLSFRNVVAFNLDEYYPIEQQAIQSYHRFMRNQLFDKVDISKENCHIPDGQLDKEQIKQHCATYEQAIKEAGGIDLQILGIG
ncbi:MAG: 6-phosphogluconolactonase, partial [Chitinophagaceae bacterium]